MATCRRCSTYHEGMLLLRAGRYERALETLQPLVAAGVDDENLDLALGMGVLLMRPKDAPPEGSPAPRGSCLRAGRAERHHMAKEFDAARRDYERPGAGGAGVSRTCTTRTAASCSRPRISTAASQQFLEEIEHQPEHVRARMQIAAARYRVDSAAGIPFAREVVKLAARVSVRPLPARPALLRHRRHRARAIPELEDRSAHGAR